MRHDRRRSPRLEPLEAKQLLSTTHAHPARVTRPNLPLDGVLIATEIAPGAFSGQAGSMGQVSAMLHGRGNPKTMTATGTVVLDNAQGSVQLSVVLRFSPKINPGTEIMTGLRGTYRISSGTGAYQGFAGSGTIEEMTDMNGQDANQYLPQMVLHSKPA